MAVAFVIMCLGILIGGHLYGRYFDSTRIDDTITELRIRTQFETTHVDSQAAELTTMGAKLKRTQAALDSIMPSPNTYIIKPNQTLIVGDGHLPVGMVGPPGNDAIILNVNGTAGGGSNDQRRPGSGDAVPTFGAIVRRVQGYARSGVLGTQSEVGGRLESRVPILARPHRTQEVGFNEPGRSGSPNCRC
jgi:hypothetical protein